MLQIIAICGSRSEEHFFGRIFFARVLSHFCGEFWRGDFRGVLGLRESLGRGNDAAGGSFLRRELCFSKKFQTRKSEQKLAKRINLHGGTFLRCDD